MTDITQQGGGGSLSRLTGGAFHIGMKEEDVIEAIRDYKKQFIAANGGGQIGTAAHARLLEQVGLGAGSERAFDLSKEQYYSRSDQFVRSQGTIDNTADLGAKIAVLQQRWDKFKDDLAGDWAGPISTGIDKANASLKEFTASISAEVKFVENLKGGWKLMAEALAVLGAVIVVWTAPFGLAAVAVGSLAFAIDDLGRALRGLPSYTMDAVHGFQLMASDPKQAAHNIWNRITNSPAGDAADYVDAAANRLKEKAWFEDMNKRALARASEPEHILPPSITQNVTASITSTASAEDLQRAFHKQNQESLDRAFLSLAGSPAY
jgi:hypothetical protein